MAWFECHEQVRDEIKLHRLAERLNVPYTQAVGLAVCLWAYATSYARSGDLSDLTASEIARASCWNGDAEQLKLTLIGCHLLTEAGHITAWRKHGVKLLESNRKAQSRWRKKSSDGHITHTLPSSPTYQPNQPNQPTNQKDINTGAAAPKVSKPPKRPDPYEQPVRQFMAYLAHKLAKCTGTPQPQAVRQAFGIVIAYLKDHPDQITELSADIDRLPVTLDTGTTPTAAWYLAGIRNAVNQRRHTTRKRDEARPLATSVAQLTASIGRTP